MLGLLFQPPFPQNGFPEADAIVAIGYMYSILVLYFFHIIVLEYAVRRDNLIGTLIFYLMSLNIGIGTLGNPYWIFKPLFNILFILYQTSVFFKYALEFYNNNKKNKKR